MEAGAVDRIVLMNGKIVKEIGKGYGENDFVVSYDTLSANFGHFKTNRNDINRYDVLIYKKDNKILCKFNIQGIENEYSLKIMK